MAVFNACNGQVPSTSDKEIRALVVAKEGTRANTAPTPDTKAEGMKNDNEFSVLIMDHNVQEFKFEMGDKYPSVKGKLMEKLILAGNTFSKLCNVRDY